VADGVESAADVLSSLAVLIQLLVAVRPPDEDHPYGHGVLKPHGLLLGHRLGADGIVIAGARCAALGGTACAGALRCGRWCFRLYESVPVGLQNAHGAADWQYPR